MRLAIFATLIVGLAFPVFAQTGAVPQFRLELRYPNGGSSMNLLDLNKSATSTYPFVHTRTDAAGNSVYEACLVTEFEPTSIRSNSVVLRYRLKWFEGTTSVDELFRQLSVADLSQVMDAAKIPWRTMTYVPGQIDEIALDGSFIKLAGSILASER